MFGPLSLWEMVRVMACLFDLANRSYANPRPEQGHEMQSPLSLADQPAKLCGPRWFYAWYMPVLWVLPVATLWITAVFRNSPDGMAFGVLPISLLFMLVFGPQSISDALFPVVMCISGTVLLGVVGLILDLLQVRRLNFIITIYLMAPLVLCLLIACVSWLFGIGSCGVVEVLLIPLFGTLIILPNIVLLFGVGSIVACAVASTIRGVEGR